MCILLFMDNDNKKLLGKRIKELRRNKGYTQEQLSELVGIETSSLSGIESGRFFPSLHVLDKMANVLRIQLADFFNFFTVDIPENLDEEISNIISSQDNNNKKIIYHAHSTEEDFKNSFMFSNTFASLYKKWLVYLYNTADVIITPTPYSKSLLESYDLNKEIYAISNGVDVEQFNPTSEQINEFIQKFNISVNDKLVISVGWLFERKGFDTFVEVAREMPNIKFMWFGDVKLSNPTSKIKKLLKELPENVILPGYVSGDVIKGAYGRADVFFFPSREETEGIVVLEALACKTQILLRDIPAFDPWMKDQINCYKGKTNEENRIHR